MSVCMCTSEQGDEESCHVCIQVMCALVYVHGHTVTGSRRQWEKMSSDLKLREEKYELEKRSEWGVDRRVRGEQGERTPHGLVSRTLTW